MIKKITIPEIIEELKEFSEGFPHNAHNDDIIDSDLHYIIKIPMKRDRVIPLEQKPLNYTFNDVGKEKPSNVEIREHNKDIRQGNFKR